MQCHPALHAAMKLFVCLFVSAVLQQDLNIMICYNAFACTFIQCGMSSDFEACTSTNHNLITLPSRFDGDQCLLLPGNCH